MPFLKNKKVNSSSFIREIRDTGVDLCVSMSFDQILKKTIISLPTRGFINCHAGALPFYRGRNPLNWVLINGEKEFGITVHYVDLGIDTGDIIRQRMYRISDNDSYATLLKKATRECANVLIEAISDIKNDEVKRINQDSIDPVGSYFRRRKEGDENLDFSQSAVRVLNFIRGITFPGPCARIFCDSIEFGLVTASAVDRTEKYSGKAGEVIGISDRGVVVKTGTTAVNVHSVFKVMNDGMPSPLMNAQFNVGAHLDSHLSSGD